MFKKLLGGLLGKVIKNKAVVDTVAEVADQAVTGAIDAQTGGLASEVEGVIEKRRKPKK